MSSEHHAPQAPPIREGAEPAQAEPSEPQKLTDPKAMRALAHPVRIALLDLFGVHERLTATQASEFLGESPANCAFHLRTLAKYGYLKEAGGGRGRERPWIAVHQVLRISVADQEPQAEVAARLLTKVWLERILDRIRRAHESISPARWEDAPHSATRVCHLTADEAAQVAREMDQILDRFENRRHDPSLRPAGALPVEYSFFGYPRADLAGPAAAG
jgi:hypothetical protein